MPWSSICQVHREEQVVVVSQCICQWVHHVLIIFATKFNTNLGLFDLAFQTFYLPWWGKIKQPLCKVKTKKMFNYCPEKTHICTWSKQGQIFTTKFDTTNGSFNTFLPSSASDASPSLHDQNLLHHQNFFGKTLHLLSPGLKAITGWSDLLWPNKI